MMRLSLDKEGMSYENIAEPTNIFEKRFRNSLEMA
jgi:hypothetical protein